MTRLQPGTPGAQEAQAPAATTGCRLPTTRTAGPNPHPLMCVNPCADSMPSRQPPPRAKRPRMQDTCCSGEDNWYISASCTGCVRKHVMTQNVYTWMNPMSARGRRRALGCGVPCDSQQSCVKASHASQQQAIRHARRGNKGTPETPAQTQVEVHTHATEKDPLRGTRSARATHAESGGDKNTLYLQPELTEQYRTDVGDAATLHTSCTTSSIAQGDGKRSKMGAHTRTTATAAGTQAAQQRLEKRRQKLDSAAAYMCVRQEPKLPPLTHGHTPTTAGTSRVPAEDLQHNGHVTLVCMRIAYEAPREVTPISTHCSHAAQHSGLSSQQLQTATEPHHTCLTMNARSTTNSCQTGLLLSQGCQQAPERAPTHQQQRFELQRMHTPCKEAGRCVRALLLLAPAGPSYQPPTRCSAGIVMGGILATPHTAGLRYLAVTL